ncbi:hypothetical protein PGT21_013363 [Puccinia graminis f. sp. tritici]|uniref:Uncharacterized protein n=1 Tax=Puccinia graminis f. sp. tritici TaxID=56615 RepID=A0A5B0NFM7_PUCGR|nr:hypothetical protein PGT21_013363 [Puccinia graminis f. sp. tritici]
MENVHICDQSGPREPLDSGCKWAGFRQKNRAQIQPDISLGAGRVGTEKEICCPNPNLSWDVLGLGRAVSGLGQPDSLLVIAIGGYLCGSSYRAGLWNRRNSANPWNQRDRLCKGSVRADFDGGSTNRVFFNVDSTNSHPSRSGSRCSRRKNNPEPIRTGGYDLEKAWGPTSPCGLVVKDHPRPTSPPCHLGSSPSYFLFEAPAVSATAALPKITSAPRGCFGGMPWMVGWGPRKTLDRQVLVRLPAVVTRGIHGQKGCRSTSNCTLGSESGFWAGPTSK